MTLEGTTADIKKFTGKVCSFQFFKNTFQCLSQQIRLSSVYIMYKDE